MMGIEFLQVILAGGFGVDVKLAARFQIAKQSGFWKRKRDLRRIEHANDQNLMPS